MSSTFVAHHTEPLLQNTVHLPLAQPNLAKPPSPRKQQLQSLFASLVPPPGPQALIHALEVVASDEERSFTADEEEIALEQAVIGRIIVALYAQSMQTLLEKAREADDEAEWWSGIERSRTELAWYLLQTTPHRLSNLARTATRIFREYDLPITPSTLTPELLKKLFAPPSLRPSILITCIFPHLNNNPHLPLSSPFELTRQECRVLRKQLQKIRDQRAESLGKLAALRRQLEKALSGRPDRQLVSFVQSLVECVAQNEAPQINPSVPPHRQCISPLQSLLKTHLPALTKLQQDNLTSLRRPSRLTRLWPRVLLIPPITLLIFRAAYRSRESIKVTISRANETIHAFFTDWLLDPIKGILETVRTGGEEGVRVISKDAFRADLDSLERMALSLSADKLSFTPAQLEELSAQIRQGDLTPVLKIYEEDIKSPIRSAIGGTLIRSLLIQVQKVKVDVDFALAGIDKLLRSQELTFGFVGVAPALAVVYGLAGWLLNTWRGGKGRGRYGGAQRRKGAWVAIRRIDRLLNTPSQQAKLTPLTEGLLLISLSHLRTYAENYLPQRTRLREGFLEDVEDLEDPELGRDEKKRVVDRMWRSWAKPLGWDHVV